MADMNWNGSIDVSGCRLLGRGNTSTVYRFDEEMVVKVYDPSISREVIEREQTASRLALKHGIPTAIPYDIVRVGESFGIRYEMMNGISLGEAFSTMPDRFDELADKYAELARNCSKTEVSGIGLGSTRDLLLKELEVISEFLKKENYEMMRDITMCVPDGKSFVHGDLHPGNIMVHNGELLLIDMTDATIGPEMFDLYHLYNMFVGITKRQDGNKYTEGTFGMKGELIDRVWDAFIRRYFETEDEAVLSEKINHIAMVSTLLHVKVGLMPRQLREVLVPRMEKAIYEGFVAANVDKIKKIASMSNHL